MTAAPATRWLLSLALCCGTGTALAAEAPAEPERRSLRAPGTTGDTPVQGTVDRGLLATWRCHDSKPRTAVVELRWSPTGSGLSPARVDATKFRDGFEKNRFETTGRLAPGAEAVVIEGPEPGIHYYWRVVRDGQAGPVASPVARFEVPVCPWDPPAGTEGGER